MKKISLNFFGEEVSINMPTDLSSLRQQISEKFMFNPSDAAEIVVSYAKDIGKKIIETEQDFVNFISDKINKIDLDISPDSKLYLSNLNILQKESDENKKELEEALKKRDEIKKRKETALNQKKIEIKNLENQIKEIKSKKKLLEKTAEKEKKQFCKEERENNKKIAKLQEKLGITKPKNDKLKACRKEDKIQMMIEKFLRYKNEDYKQIEKIPEAIVTKINKITMKIIEHKLKKMHSFEKELKDKKVELKPEEKEFFMNYPQLCNDIGKRVNSFSNYIQCETKKLMQDIAKIKKNQKEILCPLRKKLEKKDNQNKKEKKEPEKKEIKKEETKKQERKEIHWFVSCDGCKMYPLIGKRYSCQICPNFDFCENCYQKEKEKHKHEFKIVEKVNVYEKICKHFGLFENSEGKAIHHEYICDGCGMEPIIGSRFKCTVCKDFDYCEACEEKHRNDHKHPFLKIYKPSMAPLDIKCFIPGLQKK